MIAVVSDDRRPFFGINGGGRLARPTAKSAPGTDETGESVKGVENRCDDAGLAVLVEPSQGKRRGGRGRRRGVRGRAVPGGDTFSFVGGRPRMMKAVDDVQVGLADSAASEQAFEQVAWRNSSMGSSVPRAWMASRPPSEHSDFAAGKFVDMRVEIEAVAVALDGNDDTRTGDAGCSRFGLSPSTSTPGRYPGRDTNHRYLC